MGLRINIPLPGPFSYSARATPNLKPLGRAVRKAVATERSRERGRPYAVRPAVSRAEAPRYYRLVEPSTIPPTPQFVRVPLWVLVAALSLAALVLLGFTLFG